MLQSQEIKGLDMVRRDWSGLAKDVGKYVLDKILSGLPSEEVVTAIHQHLQKVGHSHQMAAPLGCPVSSALLLQAVNCRCCAGPGGLGRWQYSS